jgi:hypothetical protein
VSQLYLFIIWEKSRHKSDLIINDIKTKFVIKEIFEVKWSEVYFLNNLIRFYGNALPDVKKKALLSGIGSFLLILVQDQNPNFIDDIRIYGKLKTNENISKNKMKYREWIGEKYSIHGSISEKETNHDLTLLLGKTSLEVTNELPDHWDGSIKQLELDLFGHGGFKNMRQFLKMLNGTIKYVILRNFENLPEKFISNEHNDIDILTNDTIIVPFVCMTSGINPPKEKLPGSIKIGEKIARIDWKHPGDKYYDKRWYEDILKRAVLHKNGFYVPSSEDYFYTLFYHAIFHKKKISEDYRKKLLKIATELNITEVSENMLNNFDLSKKFVEKYMHKMKYRHTDSVIYKLTNNEFLRLIKTAKFLLKTQGILFLLNEIKSKMKKVFGKK